MAQNEFDSLLAQAPSANPYEELLKQESQGQAQAVRANIYAGQGMDPDRAARVAAIAKEYSVDDSFAEQNADDLEKAKPPINDYDAMIRSNPRLAEFMGKTVTNAAMVKDDLTAMQDLEGAVGSHSYIGDVLGGIASTTLETLSGLVKSAAVADNTRANNMMLLDAPDIDLYREEMKTQAVPKGLYDNSVTQYLDAQAKSFGSEDKSAPVIELAMKGDFAKAARALSVQVASTIPQLALIAVNPQVGLGVMFASSAGNKVAENLDQGVEPNVARANALLSAGVETGIESIGGIGLNSSVKQTIKQAATTLGPKGAKELVKGSVRQILKTGGEEGIEEAVTSISQDLLDYSMDINPDALNGMLMRAANAGLVGAAAGGATMAPMSIREARRAHKEFNDTFQAEQSKESYVAIGEAAAATKLNKRSPEKQREYLDGLTEGTAVQDVYLPLESVETYFQSKNMTPAIAAQEFGFLDQYNKASETGADLQIPFSQWIQSVGPTEHYQGLADDVRFSPDAMSVKEVTAPKVETSQDLATLNAEALLDEETVNNDVLAIRDDVTQQLKDAGFDSQEIRANSQIVTQFFRSVAQSSGRRASELYNEYGLKINSRDEATQLVGQMAAQGAVLNQTNPEAMAKLNELLPVTGDVAVDTAAQEALRSDPARYQEYLQALDAAYGDRDARAKSMGFGDVVYHGSTADVMEFDNSKNRNYVSGQGTYVTDRPYVASDYANNRMNSGVITELNRRRKAGEISEEKFEELADLGGKVYTLRVREGAQYDLSEDPSKIRDLSVDELTQVLRDSGLDSAKTYGGDSTVIFKPENIRSTSAAFDPRLASSSNILAQSGDSGPRAQITWGSERRFNIDLFKTRDRSSFIHEFAHFGLEVMGDLALRDDASQSLKDDFQTTLTWLGVESRDQIKEEQHEQWARGFEAYVMEGKAPTQDLRKAFATFKVWLLDIYKSVKALRVELSPEVRGVMDRLLAADNAASRAELELNRKPLITDPQSLGMNEKQYLKYLDAVGEAREFSEGVIRDRMMEDIRKTEKAFYKEKFKAVREEVRTELEASRNYQAVGILTGKIESPNGDMKITRASIKEAFGEDALREVPRGTTAKEGVHLELAAEMLGYRNGEDLLSNLRNLTPINEAVESETKTRMEELYPDYLTEPTVNEDAVKAAHNDKRAQVLEIEDQYLREHHASVIKDVTRRIVKRAVTKEVIRNQARDILKTVAVKDLRPNIYKRAEVRSSKLAGEALAKGDYPAAFEAKTKERLNHELYRSANEAVEQMEKDRDLFDKFFAKKDMEIAKSRDISLVNAGRSILVAFGVYQNRTSLSQNPNDYLKQMKAYDPARYESIATIVDDAIRLPGTSYKDLTLDEYETMSNTVRTLWDFARSSREMIVDGKAVQIEEAIEAVSARAIEKAGVPRDLKEYNETVTDSDKRWIDFKSIRAGMTRVESWARAFDKGDINGAATRFIVRPLKMAETQLNLARVAVASKVSALAEMIPADPGQKIRSPELGFTFKNKNELRAALLNVGNDSNMTRLLMGRRWGTIDEDGALDRSKWNTFIQRMVREGQITKADFDFAQATWNLLEEQKADAQRAHYKRYGAYFNEVTANEFEMTFPNGEVVKYKGGYYPAVADPYENALREAKMTADEMQAQASAQLFPTTAKGFTKNRADGDWTPLLLDLALVPSHIDKVLKFTHMENPVNDVRRIVTSREFTQAMQDVDPTLLKSMFVPFLQRAASQSVSKQSDTPDGRRMGKVLSMLRGRASLQVMALNVTNAVQNTTGLIAVMSRVPPKHVLASVGNVLRSPGRSSEMIMDKSDYMKTRIGENARDIARKFDELVLQPTPFDKVRDAAVQFSMLAEGTTNGFVEKAAWVSAYRDATAKGLSEVDAVNTADNVVRTALADMSPTGIAAYEAGTPFMRLFTMFSTFFNAQYNNLAAEASIAKEMGLTTKEGGRRALYAYAMIVMAPAIASELIVKSMAGQNPFDADDDGEYLDDIFDVFVLSQLKYGAAFIPFAGQALNTAINQWNDRPYDDKINLSPITGTIENTLQAPKSVYNYVTEGKDPGKALRQALQAVGLVTGLPTNIIAKPAGYVADVASGKARPVNELDFARGVVTGKKGGPQK